MEKKQKTQQEIDEQIEGLIKSKETLPEKNIFGDNNWEKIDIQIEVLKGQVMSETLWVDEDDEIYFDGVNDLYYAATEAEDWLNGYSEENLF